MFLWVTIKMKTRRNHNELSFCCICCSSKNYITLFVEDSWCLIIDIMAYFIQMKIEYFFTSYIFLWLYIIFECTSLSKSHLLLIFLSANIFCSITHDFIIVHINFCFMYFNWNVFNDDIHLNNVLILNQYVLSVFHQSDSL